MDEEFLIVATVRPNAAAITAPTSALMPVWNYKIIPVNEWKSRALWTNIIFTASYSSTFTIGELRIELDLGGGLGLYGAS